MNLIFRQLEKKALQLEPRFSDILGESGLFYE